MPTINNNLYKFINKAYDEIYKNRPKSGRKKTFPLNITSFRGLIMQSIIK